MYLAVAIVCKAFFFVLAPALLVARYVWPKRFTWTIVLLSDAIFGWLLLIACELVADRAREISERAFCEQFRLQNPDAIVLDYPCAFFHYEYTFNYELGWLKALVWLLPWLCVYATVQYFVTRRSKVGESLPNTSLERTRES